MTGLSELLARVEKAEGPGRELDLEIGLTLGGWKYERVACEMMLETHDGFYTGSPGSGYPSFTESVDEALALVERVLPGCERIDVQAFPQHKLHNAEVWPDGDRCIRATAKTPALAIITALLKALEGRGQTP